MAKLPKARYTRKSKIHSVSMARAVLRPKRKERPATPAPTDAEKALQAPAVQPPERAKKNRTGLFRGLLSCAKYTLLFFRTIFKGLLSCAKYALPLIFSVYLAAFAVTWAQYEFAFNRQRQQLSIIGAMMAAGKAKDFAPLLAELTRRKLPVRPTLWDWEYIALTVWDRKEPGKYSGYNQALMDDVAGLVRRVDDWDHADLSMIVLPKVNLREAKLSGANLAGAYLSGANLAGAYLAGANLIGAYLTGANLAGANLAGANLIGAYLTGAYLTGAYLTGANLRWADLAGAYLRRADLSSIKLFKYSPANTVLIDDTCTDNYFITNALETLAKAKTLYDAKLPKPVRERLEKNHPHLFEEP